jgi:hypothetical protein
MCAKLHIFPKQHRNNRSCIFATVIMNEKIFHKNCHTEGHFFLSFENNTVRMNLFRTRFSGTLWKMAEKRERKKCINNIYYIFFIIITSLTYLSSSFSLFKTNFYDEFALVINLS